MSISYLEPPIFLYFRPCSNQHCFKSKSRTKTLVFWLGSSRATLGDLSGPLWGMPGCPETYFPRHTGEKCHCKRAPCPRDDLFPRQAGGKIHRKRTPSPRYCLFLDRQGGKGIASARHVTMIAFSSTGKEKRASQVHAMFP